MVVPTELSDAERQAIEQLAAATTVDPRRLIEMPIRTHTQAVYVISVAAELAGMHPQDPADLTSAAVS